MLSWSTLTNSALSISIRAIIIMLPRTVTPPPPPHNSTSHQLTVNITSAPMELHINVPKSKKNPHAGALLYDPHTKESLYRIRNSHKRTLVTRMRPNPIGGGTRPVPIGGTGTRPDPIGGKGTEVEGKGKGRGTEEEEEEEKVADIEWAVFGTTRLTVSSSIGIVGDGKAVPAKRIIESRRLGRHYVFSGPDGRSYRWKEKMSGGYKLTTNDPAKTLIASYTEKKQTLFCPTKRPARLVIMPPAPRTSISSSSGTSISSSSGTSISTSMVDMVVLTFAYVDRKNSRGKEVGEGIGVLGEVVGAVVGG